MSEKHQESPFIAKQQVSNFHSSDAITHLVASNNVLLLALANGCVLRVPVQNPEMQDELEVARVGDRIVYIHLDQSGQHAIISTALGENFYLQKSMKKPRLLNKAKGVVISAVAWNSVSSRDTTTGLIVIGSSKGQLIETEIQSHTEDRSSNRPANVIFWRSLASLGDKPVLGLQLHRCTTDTETSSRWFLLASVPGQLHAYVGTILQNSDGSSLSNLFSTNQEGRVHSFPDENPLHSELHVFPGTQSQQPRTFAWMVDSGVKYGPIDSSQTDAFKIPAADKFYGYESALSGKIACPLTVALTEFHLVFLYKDRIRFICMLNEQTVFEDILGTKYGSVGGMVRDPTSNLIWVFTDHNLLRFKFSDEARNLWRIYLDRNDFINARRFCGSNPGYIEAVLRREAHQLFDEKKFTSAAEIYAISHTPLEEAALKFIEINDKVALKLFLAKKLETLLPKDKTQIAMITLWLLEMYLTELGEAKSGIAPHSKEPNAAAADPSQIQGFDTYRFKTLRDQFRIFLNKDVVSECVQANADAVYQIMSMHGDLDSLLYLAELMKDHERMLNLLIQQDRYEEALKVLGKLDDVRLIYKFSPGLMTSVPRKLVDVWISRGHALKPKMLLPALFNTHVDQKQAAEAIRYLEFCITMLDSVDQAVHNYLVALYVKVSPDKLLPYLERQGTDCSRVNYDLKYALRLCSQHKLDRASVHIYTTMGLHEEAVVLALKVDVNLAKRCASTPSDINEDLKKKLWLCIARHVVAEEQDIRKWMELLNESDDMIKIQDILPFFPDFVTIDHFKKPLCECLAAHSTRIKELQHETLEATETAQQIKSQLTQQKTRHHLIKYTQVCSLCEQALLLRAFYVFPCQHSFHIDCMEKEMLPLFSIEDQNRIVELKRQLTAAKTREDAFSAGSGSTTSGPSSQTPSESIKQELDDLLASECAFCGELAISSVVKPFFSVGEYIQELKTWE